ncbi:phosphatase PAP2 family protein [Fusobacterium necrophorum]|uniref:Phosphatidic acid phosphatase type 2/haloperoxidase domain-containing protein n=2 Tax=Fusobacterium necrophorum TaxID=859 RepID=A0AB73BT72_9FUSO|nr:phosphatase PAP2 family protein [Fusobacterium necrophorum]AYZ73770.1 phosphatase PAP2 family protein [Fusobacterium necrophorum]AZW08223.1 phosphatase PAP2 family protein [Fusobacterium necrophorum subsp. necrophorum]KDE60757.1 hypothetical protein FUSO3_12070 [Fusobacterium necrophorum BL]KDE66407.1 hypothetical protein FUSO5_02585 [Fusobacterium necrophorum BFTR-1]KDE67856.1 hypothetical protein FUSO4_02085 [Fusobacterium necrophorum DJ-1]
MTNFTVFWATFLSALYRVDYFFFERLCHESLQAEKINFFYQYFPKEVVESFFHTVTKFGEGYLELFFILIFYLFFWYDKQKYQLYKEYAWNLILVLFSTQIAVGLLKILFGRARPYVFLDPERFYGIFYLLKHDLLFNSHYYSFPSGHTITIWGTIWLFVFSIRSKRKYCLFLLGILVAVSRMYLGYHWFSDVIVSIGLSYIIAKWIKDRRKKKEE